MRLFITYSQPSAEKKALSLSKTLNLELFDDDMDKYKYLLDQAKNA